MKRKRTVLRVLVLTNLMFIECLFKATLCSKHSVGGLVIFSIEIKAT